jgi:hypothetical protein
MYEQYVVRPTSSKVSMYNQNAIKIKSVDFLTGAGIGILAGRWSSRGLGGPVRDGCSGREGARGRSPGKCPQGHFRRRNGMEQ